ncbi:hypothetical protein RhiirA5_422842 [Rhizophagus irregularis]|uniref:Cytochrome P450 n=2 Tax=Rhizophagus irregularis TaxID=588596 RepID=A0A2N0PB50_9GLOM|nr:hypothetical protein RhiirA5_422842 [Rhizophagus irregularis]GBC18548.1 cytochrome P450 [Rhizophagus irregularis DAOM 181602=DAOM 197198]
MTFTSIVSEINLITTINIIILLYVSRYYYKYFTCQSQLPGPFPLPLIGNLHQIGLNPAQYVKDNHKKYGDMFEIWVDPGTVKHANVDGLAFNGNLTTWKRNRKIVMQSINSPRFSPNLYNHYLMRMKVIGIEKIIKLILLNG